MADLLAEWTSGDTQRVLSAAHAIIQTPDRTEFTSLVPHLPAFKAATLNLDLGGVLFPNAEHIRQALQVLETLRDEQCRCTLYPTYLLYNPEKEQNAGHVQITGHSQPDWNMTYQARCLHCGQAFEIEQGESHYTWWQWKPAETASLRRS